MGRIRLVVVAPTVLIDGGLAARARTPGGATGGAGGTLSTAEVESLLENDNALLIVFEIGDELVGSRRLSELAAKQQGQETYYKYLGKARLHRRRLLFMSLGGASLAGIAQTSRASGPSDAFKVKRFLQPCEIFC
ncbi:hypothetical protein KC367_g222 [Hortaea werneckii]|nr:hypothetical protein KC367_g222 [Hortaea werneckii]